MVSGTDSLENTEACPWIFLHPEITRETITGQFCSRVAGSEFNFASLAYISDKGSETVEEVIDKARRKSAFGRHL